LEYLGLVDRENVLDAFGEFFGGTGPDEKPAVFSFLQFLGAIEHK
jgi:hypothetical protein